MILSKYQASPIPYLCILLQTILSQNHHSAVTEKLQFITAKNQTKNAYGVLPSDVHVSYSLSFPHNSEF